MHRFAFVMDQQVGLRTQSLSLERVVGGDPSVDACWVPVRYEKDPGVVARIPGVPKSIRGTLCGIREIREGLGDPRRFDGILWGTWAAKSVLDLVAAAPSFLRMDMTPLQMERMGELYGYSRTRARFLGSWKRRSTDRLYECAARLFPWNEWVAESLRRDYHVPPEKIVALSPGVDAGLFRPDPARKLRDGKVRLLFVGGDFERKGGDRLLRWAQSASVKEPWELHIVTRDEVPEIPNVVVHRHLSSGSEDLVRLYQMCDVFVLPTRADCYSLAGLEAMASGLPLLITPLGGIPELVEEGRTGFLIDPDDEPALAHHLNWLITNHSLRESLGACARRRVLERFDCRVTLNRLVQEMKESVPACPAAGRLSAA